MSELGVAQGNGAAEPLKVGESLGSAWDPVPIPSQARPKGREGVETGWVAPKDPARVYGEGTVQTTNAPACPAAAAKAEVA